MDNGRNFGERNWQERIDSKMLFLDSRVENNVDISKCRDSAGCIHGWLRVRRSYF